MIQPTDNELWRGVERRLAAVEALIPDAPHWTGPDEATTEGLLRVVPNVRIQARSRQSTVDVRRWIALVAVAVVLVVAFRVIGPLSGAGANPSPPPTIPVVPSPTIAPPSTSSSAVLPSAAPTFRNLGIAFKEMPAWLVPADGVVSDGGSSEDGYWGTKYTVPRPQAELVADLVGALGTKDVRVTTSGAAPDVVTIRSTGVAPSIFITVKPSTGGSVVDIELDRRGS